MGDEEQGGSGLPGLFAQQRADGLLALGIQVGGRFVRQQERRLRDEGASDCHALLFAL
jgi:hypothetical protein